MAISCSVWRLLLLLSAAYIFFRRMLHVLYVQGRFAARTASAVSYARSQRMVEQHANEAGREIRGRRIQVQTDVLPMPRAPISGKTSQTPHAREQKRHQVDKAHGAESMLQQLHPANNAPPHATTRLSLPTFAAASR